MIAHAAFVLLLCGHASAAETVPDLRTARTEYRRDLLTTLLPEKKAHREALLALERRLGAKSDYAGAIRAREEGAALEHEIAALEHEVSALTTQSASLRNGPLPERTQLPAAAAMLQHVTLDSKKSALTGWDDRTASAQWTLPNLPPGGYELLVTYTCPALSNASVEVKESFYSLRGTLDATNDKRLEKNLGTLRIREGSGALILSVLKNSAGESLRIVSIALVPANR